MTRRSRLASCECGTSRATSGRPPPPSENEDEARAQHHAGEAVNCSCHQAEQIAVRQANHLARNRRGDDLERIQPDGDERRPHANDASQVWSTAWSRNNDNTGAPHRHATAMSTKAVTTMSVRLVMLSAPCVSAGIARSVSALRFSDWPFKFCSTLLPALLRKPLVSPYVSTGVDVAAVRRASASRITQFIYFLTLVQLEESAQQAQAIWRGSLRLD